MKSASFIFLCLILVSCSNPGYSVRIHIAKSAEATEKDVDIIKECLHQTVYTIVKIDEKDNWKVESYKIQLNKKKFKHLERRYINFVVEYHYSRKIIANLNILEGVDVRIGNSWEGRDAVLKKEIDTIAECVVKRLLQQIGSTNVTTTKKFVSPM